MKILLVSTNAGTRMGGEALKAWQYLDFLIGQGLDVSLISHARCRAEIEGKYDPDRYILVEDGPVQRALWKSRVLRPLLNMVFHKEVARIARSFDPETTCLHFIGPISPVVPRFWPRGYRCLMGPLNGNISYPPAFRSRQSLRSRLGAALYRPTQAILGALVGDKRRADRILVSGYERTRTSLKWAGARGAQMIDVVDSGVHPGYFEAPRFRHEGKNGRFVCSGRLVGYKGFDLAIRALARLPNSFTLTVIGDGEQGPALRALARELGVAHRVDFRGWVPVEDMRAALAGHRAYLFPTLAEANGIVMQEAMAAGLPVITLNWGGPSRLSDPETSILIEPASEDAVINGLAAAMSDLARDAPRADRMSARGRQIAETRFQWDQVGASYARHYAEVLRGEGAAAKPHAVRPSGLPTLEQR